MLYPVSAQAKPTMPRLGDADQRWLRKSINSRPTR